MEDATWFVFSTLLGVTIVVWITNLFDTTFSHTTGGWNGFNLAPHLGVWGVAAFAFVIGDFFAYATHWLHHHTKTLWYFHAVHHSQENLNVLSDNRQHIVETIMVFAVTYVPGVALGLNSTDALKLGFANLYFSAWLHTNLRTNLGPLRHVLASPQFHRVHHSMSPDHFNTNYATVFPLWDVLFRTRHKDVDSYPKTGIYDETFPHPVKASPQSMVAMFVRQTVHPFKLAVKRVTNYAGVDEERAAA
jgi:sterol desaturase/sphingolipid hydroxylase (fatty acid hydroxylase superfamily)